MNSLLNILWLGLKELRSFGSDMVMVFFVVYAFTGAIYAQATGTSSEVNNASIAFVDEDGSALSKELINAFYPPRFQTPELISASEVETAMDEGRFMFVVAIPPRFEADLRAGRHPDIQLNIDATAMQQAAIGGGYIKNIVNDRISSFFRRTDASARPPINLVIRRLFNPNGVSSWFSSVVAIINQVTLLTVVLTGAAVIREREHGTLEHLLVMPLTAFEIAMAKVWANSLVILVATAASLYLIVMKALEVPFAGSITLWFSGRAALSLFRDRARDIPWDDLPLHGAIRASDHFRGRRAAASLGRFDADREPAGLDAIYDVLPAIAALRQLFANDHLSRRRHRGRLAAVRDGGGDRPCFFRLQSGAVPEIDRGDEITRSARDRRASEQQEISIALLAFTQNSP